tara:strand:+ start:216 stop:341 length:126 start_codon:yes stop_codon:yes gene_type:complete
VNVAAVAMKSGISPAELLHTPRLLEAVMMALEIQRQQEKKQ